MLEQLRSEKVELEAQGVRWHTDYRDLLREELDAVVIATPIPLHFEMTRACLERDLFVLLEKPPVPLIQNLEELIDMDPHGRVSVGFQMICAQTVQTLKAMIADGRLGQLRSIRAGACWPRHDEYYERASWAGRLQLNDRAVFDGPATNALSHVVNNMMFFAGEGRHGFGIPSEVKGELYRARPIESYDVAAMRGHFPSGVEFSLAVTHATRQSRPYTIEIRGSEGWARLSDDGNRLESSFDSELVCEETTQELITRHLHEFLLVASGEKDSFPTPLVETRGYVKLTNGLFLSSGGIHDIDRAAVQRYTEAGSGYDVPGLSEAIEAQISTGCSLREAGCSWATVEPKRIALADVNHLDF